MTADPTCIDDVFAAALAETAPGARAAYLDEACRDNPELRERVDALLAAHDAAGSFLHLPHGDATSPFVPLSERPGSTIGRYKLLEQIGEGGFGVVFMAEQERPVRRRVALKVIKLGMDTKQVLARFEAEQQALAMMEHPNIAKVLDAGATAAGRPYFVMELVRGIPITEYCDNARLSTSDRLALFQLVCSAVQHAHQKGIIHRDLKPSNILVTLHDDRAVAKVIDFGVAKATAARLTERTLFTEFRQMIGTPSYMSPEQAHLSGLDVDTRSDVYSLGVLLYELLTGTTPLDAKQLSSSSYDDLRRLICEVDPPSPSARLSTMNQEALTTLAQRRHCEPSQLTIHLRSDLDWIVMKCLEKDRTRRYESASALLLDLQRYLDGEAVEARPPTRWYRMNKFVRRNRVGVVAGTGILAALVCGLAVASVGMIQARRQAAIAKAQGARSEHVAKFLQEMLSAVRPGVARGRDTALLREILHNTASRIDSDLQEEPGVQADLRSTLAQTYLALGDRREAAALHQRAVETYRLHGANQDKKLALALGELGSVQSYLGNASDGKAHAQEGLAIARRLGDPAVVAECLECVADTFGRTGGYVSTDGAAIPYLREAVSLRRQSKDDVDALGSTLAFLAIELSAINAAKEAEELAREALRLHQNSPRKDELEIARDLFILGQVLNSNGKPLEAILSLRETADIDQKYYPAGHPSASTHLYTLATSLAQMRQYQEAIDISRAAVKSAESAYASDSPEVLRALEQLDYSLNVSAAGTEDFSGLVAVRRDVVARMQKSHLPQDAQLLEAESQLAYSLEFDKQFKEAVRIHREVAKRLEPTTDGDDPSWLDARIRLSAALSQNQEHDEAVAIMRDVVKRSEAIDPPVAERVQEARRFLSDRLFDQGNIAESVRLDHENLVQVRAATPLDYQRVRLYLWSLANHLAGSGDKARDQAYLEEAVATAKQLGEAVDGSNVHELTMLAVILGRLGQNEEALAICRQALLTARKNSTLAEHGDLVEVYAWFAIHQASDFDEVVAVCDEYLKSTGDMSMSTRISIMGAKATALRGLKDFDRAAQVFAETLKLSKEKMGEESIATANIALDLGFTLRQSGRAAEALTVYEEMIAVLARTGKLPGKLANLRRAAADAHARLGQFADARRLLDDVIRDLAADNSADREQVAWVLATSKAPEMRDGALAVQLATQAAELTKHQDASILDTLGAACAESGDFDAAVGWEEKAIEFGGPNQQARYQPRLDSYRLEKRWWVAD